SLSVRSPLRGRRARQRCVSTYLNSATRSVNFQRGTRAPGPGDGRAVRPVELVAPPPARQDPPRTAHGGPHDTSACSPGDARANARGRASAYTRGRPGAARTAGNTMAWHHA